MKMTDLNQKIKNELLHLGADIVGFGSLDELPADVRESMPIGISVAAVYPKEIIRGIAQLPTREYYKWYLKLNEQLDAIVTSGAKLLNEMGYKAIAQTRKQVGFGYKEDSTILPHKTIATRAGIGWIGKCALLVTDKYGSAMRISSILTDAPLDVAVPVNKSRCGNCMTCVEACPAKAATGKLWETHIYRDEFFDSVKCRMTVRERSKQAFNNEEISICGKCIEICPHTQKYTCGAG